MYEATSIEGGKALTSRPATAYRDYVVRAGINNPLRWGRMNLRSWGLNMKFSTYRFALVCALSLFLSCMAHAAPDDSALPVEDALNIYHAAQRQSEATVAALRTGSHDLDSSDSAYEAAFRNAVWEGLKLVRPRAGADSRAHMASLIDTAKSLADASAGSALGYYFAAGIEIDEFMEVGIQKDADDAFRLGYAQALKRERVPTTKD